MSDGKWSTETVKAWYEGIGPVRGFNYVTGTAVNSTEMWQADTFDPQTIDKELGWAEQAGLNQARVFLQYVVWEADREGYILRMKQFLEIASGHGIKTMFILFDDCAFSGKQPYDGKQPEPVPGVHNSGWTPSPGFELALNSDRWAPLERYVKDIVGQFAKDPRVLVWDLYNEPGNSNLGDQTMPLVEAAFAWAREAAPDQPLTVGPWGGISETMSTRLLELSDVLSFHYYGLSNRLNLKFILDECRRLDRPALCTECLHRQSGSTLFAILPLFAQEDIGWYVWGLVQGRTQTWLHWSSKEGTPPPTVWQHDLFHPDGTPYNSADIDLIKRWTMKSAWKRIALKPEQISVEILEELEKSGLIRRFRPTEATQNVPAGENVGESLYESEERFGPHKLIAVGVNKREVRLGVHPGHEEFLIPPHGRGVKPVYLIVSLLPEEEIRRKDRDGTLSSEHFVCLSLYPAPRGAEMFTMPAGTVHCEATDSRDGAIGSFFVTESRDLPIEWIDLERSHLIVEESPGGTGHE